MAPLLRSIKLLAKVFVILMVLLTILSYQSNYANRRRMEQYQIWRKALDNDNMKYILVWSIDPNLHDLKTKQDVFIENKCKYTNCYVTRERNFSRTVYTDFDAIIISRSNDPNDMPNERRYPSQTFVYATQESAVNYPICINKFDNYFNLTWTYKLNSDIVWTYFTILDRNGSQVAPGKNVNWVTYEQKLSLEVRSRIISKKHNPVVWFASICYTQSKREQFVFRLSQALKSYGYRVHTVGDCGDRKCPIGDEEKCLKILERYYFYLALENSLAEDYVTEKVAKALQHNTVPVVLGGANYSRFLPPGSYINGGELGPKKTAALMSKLIQNKTAYLEYFTWHNYYTINLTQQYVCELCEWLNKGKRKTYPDLMNWWNPDKKSCQLQNKTSIRSKILGVLLGSTCSLDEAPKLVSFFKDIRGFSMNKNARY